MENNIFLHELNLFNRVNFSECLKDLKGEKNLLLSYLSTYWNKWIKVSRVEISGELNTQFVYTLSFIPFVEDMEKELNKVNKNNPYIDDLTNTYIWKFINEFQEVIINHFERLGYIQKDNQLIDPLNLYSKGFFIPSDNILTFIWVTSLEE